MQPVDQRTQVRPLLHRVSEGNTGPEEGAGRRRFDFEIRMDHHRGEPSRYRQPNDIGRVRAAHEHEAAADCRRDIVCVRRSCAEPFAFERAGDERVDRGVRSQQRIDGDHRRRGTRRAAAEAAR
jgi:hypothetical protein